jgi:hypothetical protein
MRYLKLFEDFNQEQFPDVFENALVRGVKIDKEEYIDDPKLRKVSTGSSSEENYVNFLKNYKSLGLQDPTQSIHFYLDPKGEQKSMLDWYGKTYKVIPEKNAEFSFNIELKNGGLGSTYWFKSSVLNEFTDLNDKDFNSNWEKNGDLDINEVTLYQKFLIKNRVVGNLSYDELLQLSKSGNRPMQIWTESPVLHKKIIKEPKESKPYKNKPLLTKDDFERLGIAPVKIGGFYKSDFNQKIKRLEDRLVENPSKFDLFREEALRILEDWSKNQI